MLCFLFVLLSVLIELCSGECTDKVTNLVASANVDSYPISWDNIVLATYDANNNPSCYKNEADLKASGSVKAVSGTITVAKQYDFYGNTKVLLTLQKDSWFVGTVCKDGVSQIALLPDSDCQPPICQHVGADDGLCKVFSTVGKHTIGQLAASGIFNGTIPLPKVPEALRPLIKGRWKIEAKLQVGSEIVAHVKVPAEGWLYLME